MLTLYVGNKNYSSWSMRPWVLMKQAGLPFEERKVRFDAFDRDSQFKQAVLKVNPAGRVPVLVDEGLAVWDSLAICEYLAEAFPDRALWPRDRKQRARARSVCAEMHSGFADLRSIFGMNIEASLPEIGTAMLREKPAVARDLKRLDALFADALQASGGPFLFGAFSIADAFFAPVCTRIRTYALPVGDVAAGYVKRMLALPAFLAWERDALAEHDWIPEDEPYRTRPG